MAALSRALRGAVLGALAAVAAPAQAATLEYAVKANFLYKFAPFVGWPAQALAGAGPFRICVAGSDPFGAALDTAVRGQRVGGHVIVINRVQRGAALTGCHILFVGGAASAEALRTVAGQPVLTVADDHEGAIGAMIQFVLRGGRVRFTIDRAAAAASGLDVSSKLLDLAVPEGG